MQLSPEKHVFAVRIDVRVPRDPYWKYNVNILIQTFSIFLYSLVLIFTLHNTYRYLVINKRYKVLTHSMFYMFAILLSVGRITQHSLSYDFLVNQLLRTLNNMNDGFSICIGISQIIVITEIVFSMQLFQTEINSMDPQQLQKAHEGKNSKVKKLHIIAVGCVIITIAELLSRFKFRDYTVGECIFVSELVLVAAFMLYYTY